MNRKILAICAALVALGALAIAPAMSSGAVLRETVNGVTQLATGKIIGESENGSAILTDANKNIQVECNENVLTGEVLNNGSVGGVIEGTITDAWFQSNLTESGTKCKSGLLGPTTVTVQLTNAVDKNTHWLLKTIKGTHKWELTPQAVANSFTFVLHGTFITCYFRRTTKIEGTFTTDTTGNHVATTLAANDELEFVTEPGTNHSSLCPSKGFLDNLKFNLYTDTDPTPTTDEHPYPVIKTDPISITEN